MERRKSLLETANAQEAERLRQEQAYARYRAEEPIRKAADAEHIQKVLNAIARVKFAERFNRRPDAVGEAEYEDDYGSSITVPVFAIEYAHLKFVPGENTIHHIKYPGEAKFIRGVGSSALIGVKKIFSSDLRIHDRHVMASWNCRFDATALCTGCQKWGDLVSLTPEKEYIRETVPRIDRFEDLARQINLFNEAGSGLALDCGTLPVFGLEEGQAKTAVICNNLKQFIDEENERRKPPPEELERRRHQHQRAIYGLYDES